MELVLFNVNPEAKYAEYNEFLSSVMSFNIKGGVCFSVTHLLGFLKHSIKVKTFSGHFSEYVIGSSIDDPVNGFNVVGRQPIVDWC